MPTYTLELKLNTKKYSDQRYLENYFREVAKIGKFPTVPTETVRLQDENPVKPTL